MREIYICADGKGSHLLAACSLCAVHATVTCWAFRLATIFAAHFGINARRVIFPASCTFRGAFKRGWVANPRY